MKFKSKVFLAPMADVTDVSFRILCKKYGAGLTFTEMLSSVALARKNKSTLKLFDVVKEERPVGVQLMGQNVEDIKKAIKVVEGKVDLIDFNFGCPVQKIVNQGCGAALLKRPEKIRGILKAGVESTKKPISCKIRAGWDKKNINAIEIAKIAEEEGCKLITVHGKTKSQDRGSKADWKVIKSVKENVKVPVVGNGGINSPEDAKRMFEETGCDYVMIGREASRNPFIFKQVNDYLEKGDYKEVSKKDKIRFFKEYLELADKYKPKFRYIKDHSMYLSKGFKGSKDLRRELSQAKTISEIKRILQIK
jgi:tRNA-dihydrouridine synthase B